MNRPDAKTVLVFALSADAFLWKMSGFLQRAG